jgi:hypothetical protein
MDERPCAHAASPPEKRVPSLRATAEMRAAKGRLETLRQPAREDTELLATHGWLAPDGRLYACGYTDHDALCRLLGFEHESEIENAGWCKLANLEWLVQPKYCARVLTEDQWSTIEHWYARNGFPEAHFLRIAIGA